MSDDLLRPPLTWAGARQLWREITCGDGLFTALRARLRAAATASRPWHELTASLSFDELFEYTPALGLALWWRNCYVDRIVDPVERADAERRWKILATLLWSADAASGNVPSVELPMFGPEGIGEPRSSGVLRAAELSFAHLCIRSFQAVSIRHSVSVPIAMWYPADDRAMLALLSVEVLDSGTGATAQDPRSAFDLHCHASFVAAVVDAWNGAQLHTGTHNQCDGRWQIRQFPGYARPASISGASAGGAAARAWIAALTKTVPDPGVLVLASLRESQELAGVDGVAAKVRAVSAFDSGIDTIVVATEMNQREATVVVEASGACDRLRIVKMD